MAFLLLIGGCANILTDPQNAALIDGTRSFLAAKGLSESGASSDPDLVALGKALFFDTSLSQPAGQSCASCHDPQASFADPRVEYPVSAGVLPGRFGSRNAPSSAYAAFSPSFHYA